MSAAIGNGVALFLAWLFAVAGCHKLRAPAYYQRLLDAYLPGRRPALAALFAVALVELVLATGLLVPALRNSALVGAAALLSFYALMMAWQYARGRADLECGCAGPDSSLTVGPALIGRNLVCAALAMGASVSPPGLGGGWAGGMLALVLAVFLITLYLCAEQIIANAQAMAGDI